MSNSIKNIIALSLIKGVGATFIKKNIAIISMYIDNIEMLSNIGGKVTLEQLTYNLKYAEEILSDCAENNIKIVSIIDDEYPQKLLEIKDPPPIIYLKGNLNLIDKVIAVIGTRKSSDLGNKIAYKIAENFSHSWSICNGLVDGIDKNSIYQNNQILPNVIGVLSGGLNYNVTSSKVTRELAELVLENNGLLISENEPNKKENQFSGSKASRIQAGISNALILIQSKVSGGSKYTLKPFSELNRPIGVIEFNGNDEYKNDELFSANRLLITEGTKGLIEMCGIKKNLNIKSKIYKISKKEDYDIFKRKITVGNKGYK